MNWDDLEMALTANPGEWRCYLDLRTGGVQMIQAARFGEDDDWPSEGEIDAGLEAGHLLYVEPLDSSVEYGWMVEFAATARDARLRDRLRVALEGRGAFRRFKNALLELAGQTRHAPRTDASSREGGGAQERLVGVDDPHRYG